MSDRNKMPVGEELARDLINEGIDVIRDREDFKKEMENYMTALIFNGVEHLQKTCGNSFTLGFLTASVNDIKKQIEKNKQ